MMKCIDCGYYIDLNDAVFVGRYVNTKTGEVREAYRCVWCVINSYCPRCNKLSMVRLRDGVYRCERCGLVREGLFEESPVVVFSRPLTYHELERLWKLQEYLGVFR